MDAVFLKLLNMSITASWLILTVVVLRLVLKKAPKWMSCALWALVGLRLLLPFSFESLLSLIPSAQTVSSDIIYSQTPSITSGIPAVNSAVKPIISGSLAPEVGASANPLQIWTAVGSYVWLIGLAVMLIYAAASFLRLRKKVGASLHLRDNIWLCDDIKTPFILGILRPRIYLPSGMDTANEAHVVAHENAHLQRRDHWWKPLGFALLAVYWFNPLCWLAYILLCRDIELACDEKVIRSMEKRDVIAYSEALLTCSVPRRMVMACPLAFGEVGVKERIKTVLNYKKPAFWVIIVAVVACIVVAVCFLTNPKIERAEVEPFGRNYSVETIVYSAPQYSFAYTLETAPDYRLTSERQLMVMEDKDSLNWLNAGTFAQVQLSPLTFDDYFTEYDSFSGWRDDDMNAERLRLDTKKAWRLDVSEKIPDKVFYLLLQLQNGDVYLTYGYAGGEDNAEAQPNTLIRWVFKLGTASTTNSGDANNTLSLNNVITLSGKGADLTWSDFDAFAYTETGSGLYIRMYEIDERFSLWIGGGSTDEPPMYIRLVNNANSDEYIDIRTEDVEAFITAHGSSVTTVGGSDTPDTVTETASDPLDAAVSAAILEHNGSDDPDGLFHCESHVTLATVSATPKVGADTHEVIVYAMVLYQEYNIANGGIQETSGSHIPTALSFEVDADGTYTLTEYWEPRDGSYDVPDIREKFPADIAEDALDTQKYILAQKQSCYAQAVEYGKVDTDAVVKGLLDIITSSPATSSNPGDYIDAHPIEYRELTYYGDYTLRYVFGEFLKGGQTDLCGHIMRSVMDELIGGEALKLEASTGQEYFDAWRAHTERIREQNGDAYMQENCPKGWLLLQMIG